MSVSRSRVRVYGNRNPNLCRTEFPNPQFPGFHCSGCRALVSEGLGAQSYYLLVLSIGRPSCFDVDRLKRLRCKNGAFNVRKMMRLIELCFWASEPSTERSSLAARAVGRFRVGSGPRRECRRAGHSGAEAGVRGAGPGHSGPTCGVGSGQDFTA